MIFLLSLLAAVAAAQTSFEDIRKGPGANWLTYSGDYQATRHSPLSQINVSNVNRLVPQWTYHMDTGRRLEATPLVVDGVMYVTNNNEVHALDARLGRRIWMFADDQVVAKRVNRGAAVLGERIFFVTSDAHLIALNRRTGGVLWKKRFADSSKGYGATLAPMAFRDRVIVGVSGGDGGIRGYITAHSASTGEELWRLYTVPAKGEPGSESWSEFNTEYGGGATWMSGSYDPELNLVYWTTGNPWPDYNGPIRRGDNLYTCAVLAVDPSTGKMKWYFQFTPHDTHDWDAQSMPVLVDLPWEGKPRKLLLHPNRNGFFYVLDRATGRYLRATPFVDKLNWASHIDAKGRPVENPGTEPTPGGVRVCPSVRGASNWMSPSFNPVTRLLYVPSLEQCDIYSTSMKMPEPGKGFSGGGGERIPTDPGKFYLRALDPLTGKRVWEYPMPGPAIAWAGTLSTAGGVVFFGDDDGHLVAVDAAKGGHLWHYQMGQQIFASPMTFMADGKQFVSIASQTDLFTFGLFEPVRPAAVIPQSSR